MFRAEPMRKRGRRSRKEGGGERNDEKRQRDAAQGDAPSLFND